MMRRPLLQRQRWPTSRSLFDIALLAPLLCALAAGPASPATACAFDNGSPGIFGDKFEAVHPKSSVVYFAIMDAIEQGVLDRSAFEAIAPGPAGYWRAAARIAGVHRLLSTAAAAKLAKPQRAISLVLIESNLWARLTPAAQGFDLALHTPAAGDGDAVVLTSEGGLAAVLDGKLPIKVALERGLIAIDGNDGEHVRELIIAALEQDVVSPVGTVGARTAPVRMFGPAR
jgi:hypothetical protein